MACDLQNVRGEKLESRELGRKGEKIDESRERKNLAKDNLGRLGDRGADMQAEYSESMNH